MGHSPVDVFSYVVNALIASQRLGLVFLYIPDVFILGGDTAPAVRTLLVTYLRPV